MGVNAMSALNLDLLKKTPLVREPFNFIVVPGFVNKEIAGALATDFPQISKPGSFPLSEVEYGPAFDALIKELRGPAFQAAIEEKFGIDLSNRPTMVTVRGNCQKKDGQIHTDTETKIITVLVYMNESWENQAGRLRLLRSKDDIEDMIAEVPPEWGTLLVFRRSDNSWHGHKSFEGPRRVIQLNWVVDQSVVEHEQARHRMSARLKKLNPFA